MAGNDAASRTAPGAPAPVAIRPIALADAERVTRLLEGDTELALRTAAIPIPYTIEVARDFLSHADPRSVFAIVAKDHLVGMVGMAGLDEPVEIGYWVGRAYWGCGFATAAVALLIDHARRRGIRTLVADVFPDNHASARVLRNNGFASQGEVFRDLPLRGGIRTLIHYRRDL